MEPQKAKQQRRVRVIARMLRALNKSIATVKETKEACAPLVRMVHYKEVLSCT